MIGDCHVHMVLDGVDYRAAMNRHRPQPDENAIRACLSDYRNAGIVYLRDGGDKLGAAKRAGELAPEYGIEYRTPIFPICRKGRYGAFIGRTFEDFSEYRALVDEVKRENGDFIKIMISGLMDFDHYGVITSEPLAKIEIRDMIAYAHDSGFAVMAHANGAETVQNAVEAGVDSIEHGAYLNEECIACLAESDAVWTPTLVTIGNLIGCGRYPDSVLKPLLEFQMNAVRAYTERDGKIALGSDAGAYLVPHVKGRNDEYALLKTAIGANVDEVLEAGEQAIRSKFHR